MRRLDVPFSGGLSLALSDTNTHDIRPTGARVEQSAAIVRLEIKGIPMSDMYRDLILEHHRYPHNFGTLDPHDVSQESNTTRCVVTASASICALSTTKSPKLLFRVKGVR
jgi:hypothetical protein